MRVDKLRTKIVQLPLRRPIRSAIFEIHSVGCVLVLLESDGGVVGEGVAIAINDQRTGVLHGLIESLEPLVVGLDPELSGAFAEKATRELVFFGHDGLAPMSLAAIDTALWDLRGKAVGLNVARLVGACRTAVPAYASSGLWLSTPRDQLAKEAEALVRRGFHAVKMRLGAGSIEEDVARVRIVRDAIGPNVALMADANQQLSREGAIRLGRRLEEFDLAWFEEPLPYLDHEGEAQLAAALDTPIASGESEYTSRGMLRMLQLGSADVLMPDLQRMGGATEFLRASHIAAAFDVPVSSHLYSEMSLALLATLPNAIYLEHMDWLEALYGEQIELDADGCAIVPDRPGWGFSFDRKVLEPH